MTAPQAVRRTQEERSTETRRRVLDAALECLADVGYRCTTTTEVAERAGVSRGAQLHHFPTRQALVSAAVQHLFASLTESYEASFAALAPGADRVGTAVDLLWRIFQDPRLAAVLELYVAARTDAELQAALRPVAAAHEANVLKLARAYFPEAAARTNELDAVLSLALDALQGAAVRRLTQPDETASVHTVETVKRLARAALQRAAADTRGRTRARRTVR